jgi:PhzF family phenazine biosynthesis protein
MRVLVVPLPDETAVNLCRPDFSELAALSLELGVDAVLLFAAAGAGPLYARCFAPAVGVPEDPATGTAAGALGAYLVLNGLAKGPEFRVRQGDAVGRPGEIEVYATATELRVGGRAVILGRGTITF